MGAASVALAAMAVVAVAMASVAVSVVAVSDVTYFLSVAGVVEAAAVVIESSFSRFWVCDGGRGLLFECPDPRPWPW